MPFCLQSRIAHSATVSISTDSRNELIRVALNGILRREVGTDRRAEEQESSGSSDTMRDTDDIREV